VAGRRNYAKLWSELERRLAEVIRRLESDLPPDAIRDAREFIDHNEFGEAWHTIAYALMNRGGRIRRADYSELRELAELMEMADGEAADELEALRVLSAS
jgi:hypothetical protein